MMKTNAENPAPDNFCNYRNNRNKENHLPSDRQRRKGRSLWRCLWWTAETLRVLITLVLGILPAMLLGYFLLWIFFAGLITFQLQHSLWSGAGLAGVAGLWLALFHVRKLKTVCLLLSGMAVMGGIMLMSREDVFNPLYGPFWVALLNLIWFGVEEAGLRIFVRKRSGV